MTIGRPAIRTGVVHRLTAAATAPDATKRMACIAPARNVMRTAATSWGVEASEPDARVAIAGELALGGQTPYERLKQKTQTRL
ncbi:hypothetical protein ATKI12_8775 [Kitasatospora sp. Ki12]